MFILHCCVLLILCLYQWASYFDIPFSSVWQALKFKLLNLDTNVNISSQNKKKLSLLNFSMYSKPCQVSTPKDKKKLSEAFLSILYQKRKHTIAIFRNILSRKIIIDKISKFSQAGQLRGYSFFTVLYYRDTFCVLIYITWKSIFHDRMPEIYRHLF